jgi:hypothetical protein
MARYTWHPGTTLDQITALMAEGAAREAASDVTVRGYYGLVGGGAGYFLLEADEPQRINDDLVPSMGLVAWDVRQVIERDWAKELAAAVERAGVASAAATPGEGEAAWQRAPSRTT